MFACEQDDMDEATRALVEALQAEEERLVQQLETEVHPCARCSRRVSQYEAEMLTSLMSAHARRSALMPKA